MTRIDFFFDVDDKLAKVAELVDAAYKKGRKLTIYAENEVHASSLEQSLWSNAPTAFVPHCLVTSPLAAQTPVVIDWQAQHTQDDILINLQAQQPASFSRFLRLIEIVGKDETDKINARARYKFYRDRGYTLNRFDALGKAV